MTPKAVKQTRKGQTGYRAAVVKDHKAGMLGRPKTVRLGHSARFRLHDTPETAIAEAQRQIDIWNTPPAWAQ